MWHVKTRIPLAMCLAVLALPCIAAAAGDTPGQQHGAKISRAEAEILLYLMPVSKQVRREGFDVSWEIQQETEGSFRFWLYNAKRNCKGCSVTIGYYTVNRTTFDVTDDDGKVVSDQEMVGVQRILKREHQSKNTAHRR